MRVTLLGTGMPMPDVRRRGPSQLIDVGGDAVLVDCGPGALHRLLEAGYSGAAIRQIALTHLHSDHITGLADLLFAGWVEGWWTAPPEILGPPGTAAFVERLLSAFEYDIRVRAVEGALDLAGIRPRVTEITDGWTLRTDRYELVPFRVEHQPVEHAFGFRIDAGSGVVVVSGDTRRSENLLHHARGADLLIHEVVWGRGMRQLIATATTPARRARFERVLDYHTPSEQVGEIAATAGVRHLVLSHLIVPGGGPEDLAADVRAAFAGAFTVGEDLQAFVVDRR